MRVKGHQIGDTNFQLTIPSSSNKTGKNEIKLNRDFLSVWRLLFFVFPKYFKKSLKRICCKIIKNSSNEWCDVAMNKSFKLLISIFGIAHVYIRTAKYNDSEN